MQPVDGVSPLVLEHEFIPLRDEVIHWAAGVGLAEGSPTVHAARGLDGLLHLVVLRNCVVYFSPIEYSLQRISVRFGDAVIIDEATRLIDLTNGSIPPLYLREKLSV